jgi:NitT/TauT family transport system substrate-binding protein
MRFYALQLHDCRHDQVQPHRHPRGGTDWRFLNELKRELKA